VETGDEVVSEFEVEGKGEGVDVAVVMARVWAVADVDRFEGTAKGLEKEKVEEEDGMSSGRSEIASGKAKETRAGVQCSVKKGEWPDGYLVAGCWGR